MNADRPVVTERVGEGPHTIAVVLIRHRADLCRAGGDGSSKHHIGVPRVDQHADGGAAEGSGRLRAHLGVLVGEHHPRVADLDLGVSDLAIPGGEPKQLGGPERLLVEVDRVACPVDDQVGSDAVISIRNRFDGHGPSLAPPFSSRTGGAASTSV